MITTVKENSVRGMSVVKWWPIIPFSIINQNNVLAVLPCI